MTPVSARAALAGLILGLTALAAPQTARSDQIGDLDDMYQSMVALESHLLEEQARLNGVLAADRVLLIRLPDGDITAVPRDDVRDMAGHIYDWAQHWDVQGVLSPFLPDDMNALLNDPLGRAGGRIKAADMAEDAWRAQQDDLRAEARQKLVQIERLLGDVRTIAASAIRERDARKAARDRVGVIDLRPCLDPSLPSDGEALVASIGYGGQKYPAKDPFICLGPRSFLWDSGHTIREYRCNSATECFLFSEMTYSADRNKETGNLVYWLEDQRTHITFFYK